MTQLWDEQYADSGISSSLHSQADSVFSPISDLDPSTDPSADLYNNNNNNAMDGTDDTLLLQKIMLQLQNNGGLLPPSTKPSDLNNHNYLGGGDPSHILPPALPPNFTNNPMTNSGAAGNSYDSFNPQDGAVIKNYGFNQNGIAQKDFGLNQRDYGYNQKDFGLNQKSDFGLNQKDFGLGQNEGRDFASRQDFNLQNDMNLSAKDAAAFGHKDYSHLPKEFGLMQNLGGAQNQNLVVGQQGQALGAQGQALGAQGQALGAQGQIGSQNQNQRELMSAAQRQNTFASQGTYSPGELLSMLNSPSSASGKGSALQGAAGGLSSPSSASTLANKQQFLMSTPQVKIKLSFFHSASLPLSLIFSLSLSLFLSLPLSFSLSPSLFLSLPFPLAHNL